MDFYTQNDADVAGFAKRQKEQRTAKVASAAALWGDLLSGRAPSYFLQEALSPQTPVVCKAIEANYPGIFRESMTASDFPYLTGDVLDRMALGRYRDFPSAWRQFAKVNNNLRDFRTVRRIAADGLEGQYSAIAEQGEVTYGSMSETNYTYAPAKYGKAAKLSFEAIMNDDLSQFTDIPDRLGRGAARTVAKTVTQLYVDASGPHASFYTSGNANIVTSNPVLSVAGLQTAWNKLRAQTDSNGEPIMVEAAILVVPPSLEVTARNVLNAVTVRATTVGGASGQEIEYQSWIGSSLQLAIDPYIPVVASTANGSTSWFLFAVPSVGRPALEVGFVTGFAEPQLYQKMANTVRVGGGMDQMAGDFATMSQEYKGVIAFGGTRLDPKATVGSNGSGS